MRKTLHGIVPLLVVSLLVGGLVVPTVAQMGEEDDAGTYEEEASERATGDDQETYGAGYDSEYDYDTDEDWFESWYGESDDWLF